MAGAENDAVVGGHAATQAYAVARQNCGWVQAIEQIAARSGDVSDFRAAMSRLALIANLWTFNRHPSPRREWSLAKKISAVADAGFDGIMGRLTPEHARLCDRFGLSLRVGFVVVRDLTEVETGLRVQRDAGATLINVHLGTDSTPPKAAAEMWARVMALGEKVGGLRLSLETHRDYCTETPEKTVELVTHFKRITGELPRLTFDFSHWAIVKHVLPHDYARRLLLLPELIAQADQIHFRPFNGHHVQVPVTNGYARLTPETVSYLKFAREVMRLWRSAHGNTGRVLVGCPELGPDLEEGGGYCLSNFPAPWPESVRLSQELRRVWRDVTPSAETVRA